jgi:hypothetical protein
MGGKLIHAAALAASVLVLAVPATAPAANREVRVDKGIGPVDVGDRYLQVRRRLGHGRHQTWPAGHQVLVTYPKPGLTVYFSVRRDGRLRAGSRVRRIETFSSKYRLPDGTSTATSFDAALAALDWDSLDCRAHYGFAALWHRGRHASTTLFFFRGPGGRILSVGRDPASYEPPCSKNVLYGDFDR